MRQSPAAAALSAGADQLPTGGGALFLRCCAAIAVDAIEPALLLIVARVELSALTFLTWSFVITPSRLRATVAAASWAKPLWTATRKCGPSCGMCEKRTPTSQLSYEQKKPDIASKFAADSS
jgi:hypothetical protein